MWGGGRRIMEDKKTERLVLRVPTEEHNELEFEVDFTREKDELKWVKMTAIKDSAKILAWYEWRLDE